MMPCALSMPAGLITLPTEVETLFRKCIGFQSSSPTFLMVCAANFGVANVKKTSALVDFSLTMWESIVGSDTS